MSRRPGWTEDGCDRDHYAGRPWAEWIAQARAGDVYAAEILLAVVVRFLERGDALPAELASYLAGALREILGGAAPLFDPGIEAVHDSEPYGAALFGEDPRAVAEVMGELDRRGDPAAALNLRRPRGNQRKTRAEGFRANVVANAVARRMRRGESLDLAAEQVARELGVSFTSAKRWAQWQRRRLLELSARLQELEAWTDCSACAELRDEA